MRYAAGSGEVRVIVIADSRDDARSIYWTWADIKGLAVGVPLIVPAHQLRAEDTEGLEVIP